MRDLGGSQGRFHIAGMYLSGNKILAFHPLAQNTGIMDYVLYLFRHETGVASCSGCLNHFTNDT